ncbi:hypothetical protein B0H10DRAFT_2220544 [Mycena sp. CBHHK59/15]|nr:hypothetical protein B0H10DRAFT_2220544 [Mycena sp. CBHHK59/15]
MTLDSLCECGMRAAFGSFRTSQSGRSQKWHRYDASITIVTAAAATPARRVTAATAVACLMLMMGVIP